MNDDWIIAPVLLPLLMATVLLFVERVRPAWQRPLALAATAAGLAIAVRLLLFADAGDIAAYLVGNWPAPFGIVLVLDRLSAMLLLLTAVVAFASVLSSHAIARRGPHFHAFFQFQLAGLNGAFLTGDLFNLFVFFEVLLIASYALLLHDAQGRALRAGLHFVVINLVGSAFFLLAASLFYGVTGTLNFADLALRLADLPERDAGLARAAAMLLLVVFALKAALLPLGFWLPETYAAAPGPVAVLFAVMTKVGIYGIVRVSMLFYGASEGPLAGWGGVTLLVAGLATVAFGALAALAATGLAALVGALVLVSSGTLIAASMLGEATLAGALYYLCHSTLAVALLFLLVHAIAQQRGARADRFGTAVPVTQPALLGILFALGAAATAGMPPFGGFVGKVLMLEGALDVPEVAWFWTGVLGSGLVAMFALSRAGSRIFWKTDGVASGVRVEAGVVAGMAVLAAASLLWLAGAGPATRYAADTAAQLVRPALYVDAVGAKVPKPSPHTAAP